MLGLESAERDITATSRIRTSGAFRLIHIDEYAVTQDLRTFMECDSNVATDEAVYRSKLTQVQEWPIGWPEKEK